MKTDDNTKFQVGDSLLLKSPHVDFSTNVSFKKYHNGKAMIFDKLSGNQFSVPLEWLTPVKLK